MTENKTINGEKLAEFTYKKFVNNELNSADLVELIKLAGSLLNLKTIPDYAKANGLTYQGVKTCRNITELFNVKFVIDNE